ncbi:MAG: acetate--CoA ligase family protein, partial [Planctomycetes bacterium]|nr:acetate--CoA ligase family protein [Planctomycetota bacterium]
MFGLGGVLVEALRDVTFRVAPVSDLAAAAMIREVKAYKVLKGFRGQPPRDTAKLQECLQRLSQLVLDFEEIAEIDINPLLVYEEGQGAAVLDARFLLKS